VSALQRRAPQALYRALTRTLSARPEDGVMTPPGRHSDDHDTREYTNNEHISPTGR
jgi:hypothetical protein